MTLEFHVPSSPLDQFIESFLYYRDFQPEHLIDRLLPDGNVTLLIELTGAPQYLYDNQTLAEKQRCSKTWFSGNRDGYITIPSCRDIEMFVVNFRKGMSGPFLQDPLSTYTNHIVDGEQAFSPKIFNLREQLLACPTPEEMFRCAAQFFIKLGGPRLEVNPFIVFAVDSIAAKPGQDTLRVLADKVGYSQKHLIKLFKQHVGLTPKSFMRIMRFQRVIRDIETQASLRWTDVAYQSGYYDQAHFIHDFRHFSGLTPGDYVQRKNGQINYVPVD